MAMIVAVVVLMHMDNIINDTVNTNEQSIEKTCIMRTADSFLNGINEKE